MVSNGFEYNTVIIVLTISNQLNKTLGLKKVEPKDENKKQLLLKF
jgi:hypothetical protein